jgi:hypothetical protein
MLLPAFDSWREGGASEKAVSAVASPGTLDWVFAEFRADRRKRERIGGLMLRRDWGERIRWPSQTGDLSLMRHKVKEIIRAAGLRDELSFTSFRHGGFTEAADADLTDAEIRAQGRHKSANMLPRYAKRTMKQVEVGAKKRRAARQQKADDLSE